jgi:transcriptional regulator with XRE-family HTH domain
MDDSEQLKTGDRIRIRRQNAGMSRSTLGGMCGRGEDWVKKIETNKRDTTHAQLVRIARALGVADLSELTGSDIGMPLVRRGPVHEAIAPIRVAVRGVLLAPLPEQPETPEILAHRTRSAWQLWHRSRYGRIAVGQKVLPGLITDLHAAARLYDGPERRQIYSVMTEMYALCQQVLAYVSEPELYWAVADRIQMAAQQADGPHALGLGAWCLGNGLRTTADPIDAVTAVEQALAALETQLEHGDDDLRGIAGALRLHAAVSYAQLGREGDAWRQWDAADDLAQRLGAQYTHLPTYFGVGNTEVHAVSIATDLSKSGTALDRAGAIGAHPMQSTERLSRLHVETARAHHQRREIPEAVHELNLALEVSPENTRAIPSAMSLAIDLSHTRPPALAAQVDSTLERMGLAQA